jgi:hypothetical protein
MRLLLCPINPMCYEQSIASFDICQSQLHHSIPIAINAYSPSPSHHGLIKQTKLAQNKKILTSI